MLAVPGNVLNGRNRGGHALLRDGAKIVETADDILEELGSAVMNPGEGQQASKAAEPGRRRPDSGVPAGRRMRAIWTRLPSEQGSRRPDCCRVCSSSDCEGWCGARAAGDSCDLTDRARV